MANLIQTETALKTSILSSEDGAKTFSITKEVDGIEGGHAYFILLYPTRTATNSYIEDSTNNHILNHMEDLGLKAYTVINLFSKVTQSRLSLSGLTLDEENMVFIQERIFKNLPEDSKVVVAWWGNTQQNSPVICRSKQRILELWDVEQPSRSLYQLTVDGMTKDNLGVHPLCLGIRHSQGFWKLTTYPHKRVLKEIKAQLEAKKMKSKDTAFKVKEETAETHATVKSGKGKKKVEDA